METFSALLTICVGNSPVPGEFPAQGPTMRSFDVFFDLRLNKRLSKQWWSWWFETPSPPLWRHRNECVKKCDTHRLLFRIGTTWTVRFVKHLCLDSGRVDGINSDTSGAHGCKIVNTLKWEQHGLDFADDISKHFFWKLYHWHTTYMWSSRNI